MRILGVTGLAGLSLYGAAGVEAVGKGMELIGASVISCVDVL